MAKLRTEADKKKDKALVGEGLKNVRAGKQMTKGQLAAVQRLKDDEAREFVGNVSATFFEWLTTLPPKQRMDWEDRYGIPCGRGRDGINLQEVFKAIRQLIADHKLVLGTEDGSASLARTKTEKEIEKLTQQIRKISNQSHQIEKNHVRVDVMRSRMERLAQVLEQLGDQFARKKKITGADAQKMLNNMLRNFKRELQRIES